ncbi:unnamed protein product [Lepidochelys kempii]
MGDITREGTFRGGPWSQGATTQRGWAREVAARHSSMAGRGSSRMVSLERRNQALMEKIKSLQVANANLRYMNLRLKEENEVFKSTEEILLRDNDKIKQKIIQLTELQESLQDDIYILEEQLWLARPASISVNIMGTFKERGTMAYASLLLAREGFPGRRTWRRNRKGQSMALISLSRGGRSGAGVPALAVKEKGEENIEPFHT